MHSIKSWAALSAAAVGLATSTACRIDAGFIVSNLDQPPEFSTDGSRLAQSFTVGSANQVRGSVTLRLLTNVEEGQPSTVAVHLFSNNSRTPWSSLLDLGTIDLAIPSGVGDYTLTTPSAYALLADTTFRIEANPSDGPPVWAGTFSTATTWPGTLGASAEAATTRREFGRSIPTRDSNSR